MSNVKPGLSSPKDPSFGEQVKILLEILTGRRGNKITPVYEKLLTSAAAPTKAEFDPLCEQVVALQTKINELISRLDA